MWNEGFDLDELESRLYSQVYHSNETEDSQSNQMMNFDEPVNSRRRYFQNNLKSQSSSYNVVQNFRPYESMGLFPYPSVNNIVVLPPQQPYYSVDCPIKKRDKAAEINQRKKERFSERRRQKRQEQRLKKRQGRLLRQQAANNSTANNLSRQEKAFKTHRMIAKNIPTNQEENAKEVSDVITLSESDNDSDCEICEEVVSPIIVKSGDESELENENLKVATNEVKTEKSESLSIKTKKSVDSTVEDTIANSGSKTTINVKSGVGISKNPDVLQALLDVNDSLLGKPDKLNASSSEDEIICVEPSSEEVLTICCDSESRDTLISPSKEVMCEPSPETNDFLDNSFASQNEEANTTRMCMNDSESESASECDAPQRPSKKSDFASDSFSELNLDSFTSYIGSKSANTSSGAAAGAANTSKNSKQGNLPNSSDSSSESDYSEDEKQLQKQNLPKFSPITSEEDFSDPSSKSRPKQKVKRKLEEDGKVETKRPKNLSAAEDVVIKIDDSREDGKFFSSSDGDSDVEVVPNEPLDDENIELVNIESTSPPAKSTRPVSPEKPNRFSSYWTEDMQKFYKESWGHEDFSVEEEQKKMSDDPSMWRIMAVDRIHPKLLPKGPKCHRCREYGHKMHHCTKYIGPPKCILCGESGHTEGRCPNKLCTSCGRRSEYSTTYCSRCANSRHIICRTCSMPGHPASNCPDLWRRYHLTTGAGPIHRPRIENFKRSRDLWCSGCATRGHLEVECYYYNRMHLPSCPYIVSYEDVYRNRFPDTNPTGSHLRKRYFLDNRQANRNSTLIDQQSVAINAPAVDGGVSYSKENELRSSATAIAQINTSAQSDNSFLHPKKSCESDLSLGATDGHVLGNNEQQVKEDPIVSNQQADEPKATEQIEQQKIVKDTKNVSLGKESALHSSSFKFENCKKNVVLKLSTLIAFLYEANTLKNLEEQFNVCIKHPDGVNCKAEYLLVVNGPGKCVSRVFNLFQEFRRDYELQRPLQVFTGEEFSLLTLRKYLKVFDNPCIGWRTIACRLHLWLTVRVKIEPIFVALNSILLGKINIEEYDTARHMTVLRRAAEDSNVTEEVYKSFDVIFRNDKRLNFDYIILIRQFPPHNQKANYDFLLETCIQACEKNGMHYKISELKHTYDYAATGRFKKPKCKPYLQVCRDIFHELNRCLYRKP